MLFEYDLETPRNMFYDITGKTYEAVTKSGAVNGLCVVYCPHTTAGITVNEGYDADVTRDLVYGLEKAFPNRAEFRHSEGNSSAHLKAGVIGASVTLIVENRKLLLGTWQTLFFCEFDAPRNRKFYVKILTESNIKGTAP